jgi:tRNA(Ile)-lysidine synthase TilS/MesJ
VVRPHDSIVIGLSGGRDSVAYLTLLERTRDRLPQAQMTAVTITGLPDWEEPATFAAARESGERLGIEQVIVTAADVERVFRLRGRFVDAMNEIVAGEGNHLTMVIGHQVLRRMLEVQARDRGAGVVAFGFNADDLVASMVTWFTSGFRMGGIPVREIGGMRYIFPLYRITKKE